MRKLFLAAALAVAALLTLPSTHILADAPIDVGSQQKAKKPRIQKTGGASCPISVARVCACRAGGGRGWESCSGLPRGSCAHVSC